jgi:GT2 family glycosyltransferase
MKHRVSVLIVTWNSWFDLKRCLESVRKLAFREFEVIVVDNGSTDDTVRNLRHSFPEVRLEQNDTNKGLPHAVNQGLRLARGDYVMLLDVDTEVRENTLDVLVDFMERHPDVSLAAPRIYTPEGKIEQSARSLPSVMNGLFGRQSVLTRLFPGNPFSRRYLAPENLEKREPFRVEQVSAACMFMRRSLVAEAGPWDEGYRCYWVDSDWCARLKQLGKKVYCVPGAGIVHYENNRSGKKKSPWRIWHFHIAAFRLYRKNYTQGLLDPRALFAAFALVGRAGILLLLNSLKSDANEKTQRSSV